MTKIYVRKTYPCICECCKKDFFGHKKRRFCSKSCSARSRPKKNKKQPVIRTCEICKKDYPSYKKAQRFCSKGCQYDSTKGPIVPRVEVNCVVCNAILVKISTHKYKIPHCAECYRTRRKGVNLTEEHKKIISETRRKDWARGTYSNAVVGKTKWYEHVKPNGETIKCQGTWELSYAKYLDSAGIKYEAHKGALWYVSQVDGIKKVYLPDFYLIEEDTYIDIKNDYLLKIDSQKIEDIKRCNPQIKIKIVTKKDLKALGVL